MPVSVSEWNVLPSGRVLVLTGQDRTAEQSSAPVVAPRQPGKTDAQPPSTSQEQPGEPAGPQKPPPDMMQQCMPTLLMIVPFMALMYFLMIRPQQKQQKERQRMLTSLQKGDTIVTSGGVHGQVAAVEESTVIIKFGSGDGQRMKIDRSAVGRVIERQKKDATD